MSNNQANDTYNTADYVMNLNLFLDQFHNLNRKQKKRANLF
jgi:hypothetical protein